VITVPPAVGLELAANCEINGGLYAKRSGADTLPSTSTRTSTPVP
jgi:hypothetical protein